MSTAEIYSVSNKLIRIRGELNFNNVLAIKLQGKQLISAAEHHCEIDFSEVTRAGSAALTLLSGWLRHAGAENKQLAFSHLPADLLGVAQVSGVDQILPIK